MIEAYKDFWKRYAFFRGKSSRKQYWFSLLANVLILGGGYLLLRLLDDLWFAFSFDSLYVFREYLSFVLLFYLLAMVIPSNTVAIRRLRDGGYSPFCIFLECIPFLGSIILLVLLCTPSTQNESEEITTQ